MPLHFGKKTYNNFNDAVRGFQRSNNWSKERATKYVGKVYWREEGHKKLCETCGREAGKNPLCIKCMTQGY